MGPRGLLIIMGLWVSFVGLIFVVANIGQDDPHPASHLSFDVKQANRLMPDGLPP
jgi:hypothetical protein